MKNFKELEARIYEESERHTKNWSGTFEGIFGKVEILFSPLTEFDDDLNTQFTAFVDGVVTASGSAISADNAVREAYKAYAEIMADHDLNG